LSLDREIWALILKNGIKALYLQTLRKLIVVDVHPFFSDEKRISTINEEYIS
jgi:hypothetical protein